MNLLKSQTVELAQDRQINQIKQKENNNGPCINGFN